MSRVRAAVAAVLFLAAFLGFLAALPLVCAAFLVRPR